MGPVANAASLIKDETFGDWCMAAAAYQARQVVLEPADTPDHQARLDFATNVIGDPPNYRTRFTVLVATDPDVATAGATAAEITESVILAKIKGMWTLVAQLGRT